MTERRLTNTIYIMIVATRNFRNKHDLSIKEFLDIDEKYGILSYIAACPDEFDCLPETEMADEIDQFCREISHVNR